MWGFVWWVGEDGYFWAALLPIIQKRLCSKKLVHSRNIKAMANLIDKLKAAFSLESSSERELGGASFALS